MPALPLFYGRVTRQQRIIHVHVGLVLFNHWSIHLIFGLQKQSKSPYNKELINLQNSVSIRKSQASLSLSQYRSQFEIFPHSQSKIVVISVFSSCPDHKNNMKYKFGSGSFVEIWNSHTLLKLQIEWAAMQGWTSQDQQGRWAFNLLGGCGSTSHWL